MLMNSHDAQAVGDAPQSPYGQQQDWAFHGHPPLLNNTARTQHGATHQPWYFLPNQDAFRFPPRLLVPPYPAFLESAPFGTTFSHSVPMTSLQTIWNFPRLHYDSCHQRQYDLADHSHYIPQITQKRRYKEMVEVYNGDTFVKKIGIQLLIRFSFAAKFAFPLPAPVMRRPKVCPPLVYDLQTGFPVAKRLYLNVQAPENPTHGAIELVLKWMHDNEGMSRQATLMNLGPPRLDEVDFVALLDIWQAVLAFKVRPPQSRIAEEICRRFRETAPTLDVIKSFTRYIPIEDDTTACWIIWYKEFKFDRYTTHEINQIDAFVSSQPDLDRKFRETFGECAHEEKRRKEAMRTEEARRRRIDVFAAPTPDDHNSYGRESAQDIMEQSSGPLLGENPAVGHRNRAKTSRVQKPRTQSTGDRGHRHRERLQARAQDGRRARSAGETDRKHDISHRDERVTA